MSDRRAHISRLINVLQEEGASALTQLMAEHRYMRAREALLEALLDVVIHDALAEVALNPRDRQGQTEEASAVPEDRESIRRAAEMYVAAQRTYLAGVRRAFRAQSLAGSRRQTDGGSR